MDRKRLIDRKHEIQAEYRRARSELDGLPRNPAGDRRRAALEGRLTRLGAEELEIRLQIDRTPDTSAGKVEPMSWFNRFMSRFRSEAADVREGLASVGKSLDEELAKKERELAAGPEERIEMILEENEAADERFAELEAKVRGEAADPEAEAEVDGTARGPSDAE